jgi:tetratricopeptide (TPR) repeat protein
MQTAISPTDGPAPAPDADDYEALWRAAVALMVQGQQAAATGAVAARDEAYERAESLARRAVAQEAGGADGHCALAQAIGLASLAKDSAQRIMRAGEIRLEALRALELDPRHDGAWHVLGKWQAAIARIAGFQKMIARGVLGGRVFDEATWDRAILSLEKAVELAPHRIDHRLALAEVYIERQRYAEARTQLDRVAALPLEDPLDPSFQQQALARLKEIEGKRGR